MLEGRSLAHPENLLSQLLPLTNLPKLQGDINTFFVPAFSSTPSAVPTSKKLKIGSGESKVRKGKKGKGKGEVDATPEWMAYYESSESEDETKSGKKRSLSGRSAQLSVHASIHSIPSHQNMYTSLWEAVLGTVPLDEAWTRKILVGLHGEHGIFGHMKPERRFRVADWLGGLVDRGGALAMLAMNGLFVLMTQYNL
jgi:U3 small nucleolar RNA-associated protein 19